MKMSEVSNYVCPATHAGLRLETSVVVDGDVVAGVLTAEGGEQYPVEEGIPDFTSPRDLDAKTGHALQYFEDNAEDYEKYQHLTYETFYQKEEDVRNGMIDLLRLKPNQRVLEINAGSGRDSLLIAKRLGREGALHVQDISKKMLAMCRKRLEGVACAIEMHRGNGCRLPYPDKHFNAVYSFGGIGVGTYADPQTALKEMVRVTRPDGRVVFGGASMGPWLRDSFFAKVLTSHNYLYKNQVPLEAIPVEARHVTVRWILGGGFFVVDFTVGEGEPEANFNFEIPGVRGGTHLTRYLGQLEGVTRETKELALKARDKCGKSMHAWLDAVVRDAALRVLEEKEQPSCDGSKRD